MQNATGLSIVTAAELAASDLAPRRELLGPLLAADTTALVYGPPGIGKSFFALAIAWAVASGGRFLGWQAPRPRRVLYVDGELGSTELRRRLALFGRPPERLELLTPDLNTGPLLDLAENAGLVRLMTAWDAPELVILDPLSTLAGLGSGDPDRWHRLQRFLLHQRQNGRAVLLVHHANRKGGVHGTTRRASAVDLVIALRRPDALGSGNARFELHFEKTRQREPLRPVLAELQTVDGSAAWRWDTPAVGRRERLAILVNRGLGTRELCAALGISRSRMFALKAEARALGLLHEAGGRR